MSEDRESQSIKYRLIGALVIVASFTLAWLLLLDHDVKRQSQWAEKVPIPIEIERFEVSEPKIVQKPEPVVTKHEVKPEPIVKKIQKSPAKVVTSAKPVVKNETTKAVKQYTQLNKNGLPDAWVLQVASFKEKTNAKKLQQDLLKHHFPAYVKAFNLSSGRIYRVIIGPKMDKSRAQKMAKDVEKKLGMKTLLVAYKPGFEE